MSDLVFYTHPMSRGRIVRWMLEEVGEPYETKIIDYGQSMKTPDYLALNPMGKVPTLVHKGTIITECAAICAYLADAFPKAGLAPAPGTPERGDYYRWLFFGAGPVEQAVVNASFGFTLDDMQQQGRTGYGSLDRVCDALEGLLADGRDYMLGERFSAVDVYLGSQIGWGLRFGSMPERPGFAAFAGRILDRPASVRAREIDDALVPKQDGAG